jgi:hypothetical protein
LTTVATGLKGTKVRSRVRTLVTLLSPLVVVAGAGACSESFTQEDLAAFCDSFEAVDQAPSPEVGSNEHVTELSRLAEAAPPEIADDIRAVRNHIRDNVSPDDPESQNDDAYPRDVLAAVSRVDQFVSENC